MRSMRNAFLLLFAAALLALAPTAATAAELLSRKTSRYDVHASTEEGLQRAAAGVEHALAGYERYFGEKPGKTIFVLYDEPAQRAGFDEKALHENGTSITFWPSTMGTYDAASQKTGSSPTKTTVIAHEAMHKLLRARFGMGLPTWFHEGFSSLIELPDARAGRKAAMLENFEQVFPFPRLFTMQHPASQGRVVSSEGGPRAGGVIVIDASTPGGTNPKQFYAMGMTLLEMIAEREGDLFVGRIAEGLARGESMADILKNAKHLPHDVAALQDEWSAWVRRSPAK